MAADSGGFNRSNLANHTKLVRLTGDIFANQRFGGVSRYITEIADGVKDKEGWDAVIDSPLFINAYLRTSPARGRRCFLPRRPVGLATVNRKLLAIAEPFRRQQPAIIHEMFFDHRNFRNAQAAAISTFYDMIHERFVPDASIVKWKKETALRSDRCIAISETTKKDLIHLTGITADTVDVIYLASRMRPNFDLHPAIKREDYILWVGPRAGYKNFENFSKAFAKSRAGQDGMLVVCAGGPAFTAEEIQSWQRLGIRDAQIQHLTPNEEELASLYTHATLFVYASLYEGFGIPPLEAMNCGCPVAATNTPAVLEVVGDAAALFDPSNVESITHCIDEFLEDSGGRDRLVDKGRARAAMFSWEKCIDETLSVYRKALESK